MSDEWQYRVRVRGPDRAKWLAKATEHKWGLDEDGFLIDWPMNWVFGKKTVPAKATWYNVEVDETPDYAEFLGNFGGSPALAFSKDGKGHRAEPALFDGLDIEVEVVGHSWCCDCPGGIYSYRDVWLRGERVSGERADDSSVANRFAPELLVKFPDIFTREERERFREEDDIADEEYERDGDDDGRRPVEAAGAPDATEAADVAALLHGLVKRPVG